MLSAVVVVVLAALGAQPPGAVVVRGVVVDPAGAPIPAATVRTDRAADSVPVGDDGRFEVPVSGRTSVTISAAAPGFAERSARLDLTRQPLPRLELVLAPRAIGETVVVTATRGAGPAESAVPVSVLTASDLQLSASPALDDALRTVPGFGLFRRTSSRTANPTTQGASLRGLAASGASRALVVADGAVLNDPFGGWVYWNRVPQAAIERVEVARGGLSHLYGADALAGVVQVLTKPADTGALVLAAGDSQPTARASAVAAVREGRWSASLAGEASGTDGSWILRPADRGAIDTRAGADWRSVQARAAHQWPAGWRVRVGGDAFVEERENGTRLQVNDTTVRAARVELSGPAGGGFFEASALAGDQIYEQSFSAVGANRESESLTLRQRVPANQHAYAATWTRELTRVGLLLGGDVRDVDAVNLESRFFPDGRPRGTTATTGFARTSGLFGRVRTDVGRLTLVGTLRSDWWQPSRDEDGRQQHAWSPRVSASVAAASWLQLRGSVGRSFRAPTLNELYRGFRVGNIETLPNPELTPERLLSLDGGALLTRGPVSALVTGFWGDLEDAVANVTLRATPQLITRQRANAGGVRAAGLEAEGEWRLRDELSALGSFAWLRSRYRDTPGISGNVVAQVPAWQGSAGLRWLGPAGTTLQGQLRVVGEQFEDDRNTLVLDRAAVVDLSATRRLGARLAVFAAVENLFDSELHTGRTPLVTIGLPRTWHAGVRVFVR